MVRRWFSIAGIFAVAVVMLAADVSQAGPLQRLRSRLRGDDEGSGGRLLSRRSFYRGAEPAPTVASNQIALDIQVPNTNAEVTVNGQKLTGTGTTRQFTADSLATGQTYEYKVKAKWTESGKEMSRERTVTASPGQRMSVSFTQPDQQRRRPGRTAEPIKQPKESKESEDSK